MALPTVSAPRRSILLLGLIVVGGLASGMVAGMVVSASKLLAGPPLASADTGRDGRNERPGMVWIPGGDFFMGSDDPLGPSNEKPLHKAHARGFWIDRTPVTNAQFSAFVRATGYVTVAERAPDWAMLKVQLPPGTPQPPDEVLVPGSMVFAATEIPEGFADYARAWRYVPGANWRQPHGPGSSLAGKEDHPVVQVAYDDALAYAQWVGKRLPTEVEWEFAARAGLDKAKYAWGGQLQPRGRKMANYWEPGAEQKPDTSRVCAFPANAYGLCDMTGNVWQWTADWYRADAYEFSAALHAGLATPEVPDGSYDPDEPGVPENAPKRAIRGGSYLCSAAYCLSYRPSARRGSDPYTSMPHIGFRLVLDRDSDAASPGGSSRSEVLARSPYMQSGAGFADSRGVESTPE